MYFLLGRVCLKALKHISGFSATVEIVEKETFHGEFSKINQTQMNITC